MVGTLCVLSRNKMSATKRTTKCPLKREWCFKTVIWSAVHSGQCSSVPVFRAVGGQCSVRNRKRRSFTRPDIVGPTRDRDLVNQTSPFVGNSLANG